MSSVYVAPGHRFVVSLIAGVADVADAKSAAEAVLGMTRHPGKSSTVWVVHDRDTGLTVEVPQGDFESEGAVYVSGEPEGEGR